MCGLDEALLLHSQTLSLGRPASRTIEGFRDWFENRHGKGTGGEKGYAQLRRVEGHIYEQEDDLVCLYTPLDEDSVTRFITRFFGWLFIVSHGCSPEHFRRLIYFLDLCIRRQNSIYIEQECEKICDILRNNRLNRFPRRRNVGTLGREARTGPSFST